MCHASSNGCRPRSWHTAADDGQEHGPKDQRTAHETGNRFALCLAAADDRAGHFRHRRCRHVVRRRRPAGRAGGLRGRTRGGLPALYLCVSRHRAGQSDDGTPARSRRAGHTHPHRRRHARHWLRAVLDQRIHLAIRADLPRDRHVRIGGDLRPGDLRHLTVVRAAARHRRCPGGIRQLCGGRDLADPDPMDDSGAWLALCPSDHRPGLRGVDPASGAVAAQPGAAQSGRRPADGHDPPAYQPVAAHIAASAGRRRPRLLRGDVDAAGSHRRLLRRPGLRRGERCAHAVADAGLRYRQPDRVGLICRTGWAG